MVGKLGAAELAQQVSVTNRDGTTLTNNINTWLDEELMNNTAMTLFIYRVCDAEEDEDATVTNRDGTWITNNANIQSTWFQFYPLLTVEWLAK